MKTIAVFGSSGRTGAEIIHYSLIKGYKINAFCRKKSSIAVSHEDLNIFEGDLLKFNDVKSALKSSDSVICAFGSRPPYKDIFCSEGTKNIIKAMYDRSISRLICITGAMIGDYPGILSGFMNRMKERFNKTHPLTAIDRLKQEIAVKASGLNFTILKPPRLSAGKLSKYIIGEKLKISGFSYISRKTAASVILDILNDKSTYQKAYFIKKQAFLML